MRAKQRSCARSRSENSGPGLRSKVSRTYRPRPADQFGVRQIGLYHNGDGAVYCLLDGPDEEAIHRHHVARGVPCGDVHQVHSLALLSPPGDGPAPGSA
jgi:Nickel responsive protein SCO4226-like